MTNEDSTQTDEMPTPRKVIGSANISAAQNIAIALDTQPASDSKAASAPATTTRLNDGEKNSSKRKSSKKRRASRSPSQSPSRLNPTQRLRLDSPASGFHQQFETEQTALNNGATTATFAAAHGVPSSLALGETAKGKRKASTSVESLSAEPSSEEIARAKQDAAESLSRKRARITSTDVATGAAQPAFDPSIDTLLEDIDGLLAANANNDNHQTGSRTASEKTPASYENTISRWVDSRLHILSDTPHEDMERLEKEAAEEDLLTRGRLDKFEKKYGDLKKESVPVHPVLKRLKSDLEKALLEADTVPPNPSALSAGTRESIERPGRMPNQESIQYHLSLFRTGWSGVEEGQCGESIQLVLQRIFFLLISEHSGSQQRTIATTSISGSSSTSLPTGNSSPQEALIDQPARVTPRAGPHQVIAVNPRNTSVQNDSASAGPSSEPKSRFTPDEISTLAQLLGSLAAAARPLPSTQPAGQTLPPQPQPALLTPRSYMDTPALPRIVHPTEESHHVPVSDRYYSVAEASIMQQLNLTAEEFDGDSSDESDEEDDTDWEGEVMIRPKLKELLENFTQSCQVFYQRPSLSMVQKAAVARIFKEFCNQVVASGPDLRAPEVKTKVRQPTFEIMRLHAPETLTPMASMPRIAKTIYGWRFNGEYGSAFIVDWKSVWILPAADPEDRPKAVQIPHVYFSTIAGALSVMQHGPLFALDEKRNILRLERAKSDLGIEKNPAARWIKVSSNGLYTYVAENGVSFSLAPEGFFTLCRQKAKVITLEDFIDHTFAFSEIWTNQILGQSLLRPLPEGLEDDVGTSTGNCFGSLEDYLELSDIKKLKTASLSFVNMDDMPKGTQHQLLNIKNPQKLFRPTNAKIRERADMQQEPDSKTSRASFCKTDARAKLNINPHQQKNIMKGRQTLQEIKHLGYQFRDDDETKELASSLDNLLIAVAEISREVSSSNLISEPIISTSPQEPYIEGEQVKACGRLALIDSMLQRPELVQTLVEWLAPKDLLSLYAISKPFHYLFNGHQTSYILLNVRRSSPHAERIFPYLAYADLCIRDPAGQPHAFEPTKARFIPGLKWLQMVHARHRLASDILWSLWRSGHKTPPGTLAVVQKMMLLMDIPTNPNRIALVHNRRYWADDDLLLAACFIIKLDMRCTEPWEGRGETQLRDALLGQKSMRPMLEVLEHRMSLFDMMRLLVRYDHVLGPWVRRAGVDVAGVPLDEVGAVSLEGFGETRTKGPMKLTQLGARDWLMRPDELIVAESVRRMLRLEEYHLDCMMYGYWGRWAKGWPEYEELMKRGGAPKQADGV